MMKFKSITLALILSLGFGFEAWGQGISTNGAFGQRSMGTGGTSMGMSGMGMSGMGMSGMSGMGMSGMGGMGGMGMGGMGMSSSNLSSLSGASSLLNSMGSTLGNSQSGQFIGGNTGQTFIGGNTMTGSGQTQNMMGGRTGMGSYGSMGGMNFGTGGMGGMGGFGQFGGMRGMNSFGQMGYGQNMFGNQQNRNQAQMLMTRHVDTETTAAVSTNFSNPGINSGLNQLLKRTVLSRSPSSSIEASYQGNIVVLKGTVATARDRELAAKLVRLEPGVDRVQNDLIVRGAEQAESQVEK